jgi:hypothetical protein
MTADGAAWFNYSIEKNTTGGQLIVQNLSSHAIGILSFGVIINSSLGCIITTRRSNCHELLVVVPKGTPLPATQTVELRSNSSNKSSVCVVSIGIIRNKR